MKVFKQIISEVTSFNNNTLWVMTDHGFQFMTPKENESVEHPVAFPRVYFPGRTKTDLMTMNINMPDARAWGRIDNQNKDFHIITEHGLEPYGFGVGEKHQRRKEDDAFTRLKALKTLKTKYPDHRVHWGHEGEVSGNRTPVFMSASEAEKRLMSHLGELSEGNIPY